MADNFFLDNQDLQFHFRTGWLASLLTESGRTEDTLEQCRQLLEKLGALCGEKIAPRAIEVDRLGATFADGKVTYAPGTSENLRDLCGLGLMGVTLPRQYGGLELPCTAYSMMTEMVSRADASLQNLIGLQAIAETICRFASDEQKQRLLPKFATGEVDGAMALTEPEAGSDLQSVQTTATYDAEHDRWLLNGKKRFITNGCAKVMLVLARSEEGTRDGRGLSMFILEPGPEVTINSIEDKMGIHGSPTCELIFQNAPAELVGQRRRGLTRYVMSLMNGARLAISSQAVGIAEAAFRAAWEYTQERQQFGKCLAEIIPVREMLTRIKTEILAGRTLVYETCRYVDLRNIWARRAEAPDASPEAIANEKKFAALADALTPVSKYFCTEMCNQVCYDAIQCHGGKGYMRDKLPERYYRDARITNIYEGTSQMQVIAAIAGVRKRVLVPLIAEILASTAEPAPGIKAQIQQAADWLEQGLAAVEADGSTEFAELTSRRLVRMQTIALLGALLLRGTDLDPARLPALQRFLAEHLPEAKMHLETIKLGSAPFLAQTQELLSL